MNPEEVVAQVAANIAEALGLRLEQRETKGFCLDCQDLFEYGDDNQLLRIRYTKGNMWSLGLILSKRQTTQTVADSNRYFTWSAGVHNHEELLALRPPEDVKAIVELMKRGE